MAESWTWTCADAAGAPVTGEPATDTAFPTQGDAEAWLSETWPELADAGIDAVTLHRDGEVVYGPMSLSGD